MKIAGHGYRWIDYSQLDPQLEREHINKTLSIIKQYTGAMPWGWYTGRKSRHTRKLLQAAGLRYDSESYADDLPYWRIVNDQPHLI
ncbi:[similarity to] polysaccharide deacetylase family protein, partial [methanotrophic bacterial endosymbiont of Bathymodiolus sp.]